MHKTPSIMRKMYLFLLLVFAGISGTRAQELLRESVYFDTDEHELTTATRHILDELVKRTIDLNDFHLQILAFTDDRGTTDYNRQLAVRRGEAVQDYLQQLGLLAAKTSVQGMGEIELAEPDEAERALNRRVDLILTARRIGSLGELWEDLSQDRVQAFTLEAGKEATIQGKAGTKIWLPPNALTFADGSQPQTPIKLLLKEAYAFSDMIIDGLSTQSDDRLLETGGMIYLAAEANGQPLQLAADQALTIGMPTGQLAEGMQLFVGEQGTDGSVSNWKPTQQPPAPTLQDVLQDLPPKPALQRDWIYPPKEIIDESGEPKAPRKPVQPHKPFKPRRESITYTPGGLKGVFLTKAKRQQKEEALYASRLQEYEQKMEKYRARKGKYEQDMVVYLQFLEAYKLAHKKWDEKLQKQRDNFRSSPAYLTYLQEKEKSSESRRALYEQQMEEWYDLRFQTMADYEAKYGKVAGTGSLTLQYVYQVNRLGWINCDRFYDVPAEEKVDLAIEDSEEDEAQLFVIFKDIRNIMKARQVGNEGLYQVNNLPRGMEIRVVGVKVVDGKPQLAIRDTKVSDQSLLRLQYQTTSIQKIKLALNDLNS